MLTSISMNLDLIKLRAAAKARVLSLKISTKFQPMSNCKMKRPFTYKGKLDFINTGLNASTGTMEFRAILNNKDYALFQAFFQVRVAVTKPKKK